MRKKTIAISLDSDTQTPLSLQIAEKIVDAIQDGRLIRGLALPGTRALAKQLNISRTPVAVAYSVLQEGGWIRSYDRSGAYVADNVQGKSVEQWKERARTLITMAFSLPTRQDLVTSQMAVVTKLSEGLPDSRLFAAKEMGKAYFRALNEQSGDLLNFGDPRGDAIFRESLSKHLESRWRRPVSPASIFVTRGNKIGLNLLAKALLTPGDLIAVEDPGNPVAWECFRQAGARLVGVPVDQYGVVPEALEERLTLERIRLLYLTPRFQMPTTVTLSAPRRRQLLDLAQSHRFVIVEDDPEAEFTYEPIETMPLAAGNHDGNIMYLSSFSRLLAPGIRLGYMVGPSSIVNQLASLAQQVEGQGDQVLERAMAELLTEGEILRHVLRARVEYQKRRELALTCLMEVFESSLDVEIPEGGLSLWVETDPFLDLDLWRRTCADRGVLFQVGRSYSLDKSPIQAFRLGFASFNCAEMAEILVRMREAYPE